MAWPFTSRRQPEPVVAAAVPYRTPRPTATGTDAIAVRKPRDWQKQAYDYYDLVWLVKKGLNLHADLIARTRLYVGYIVSDEEERPTEVMAEATRAVEPDKDGNPGRPNALTVAQARTAVSELDRVQATQGGQAAILHDLDLNLQIAGECSLVGYPLDPNDPLSADEEWTVLSVEELRQAPPDETGPRYSRLGPTGKWEPLPAGTFALRVWRPHPRRGYEPDAPMRGALENCDTLTVSTRMVRSQMRSRTSAGIQFFPQEALKPAPDPTRPDESPTLDELDAAWLDAVTDEGSPAAVAPVVIPMPLEYIAAAKEGFATFDRPLDKVAVQLRAEAKGAIVEALPLPPEMVEGLGTTNHWSASQITQNVFDQHAKPDVELLCASLTSGLFRPAWRLAGLPADLVARLVIWYDPSGLVAVPDQMDNSKQAYEEGLIGPDRRRRDLRYADDDAPTDEERAQMAEWLRLQRGAPAEDTTLPPGGNAEPVVAAVNGSRSDRLATAGRRLAAIDRDLLAKILGFSDALLTAALTRAGNRALSSMPRSVAATQGAGPREALVAALGRDYVESDLGMTDAELLASAFADLDGRFLAWTTDAQRKALRVAAGVTGLSVEDQDRLVEESQERRTAGLAVLAAGLLDLARARLYDPHPAAPPLGEHDASLRVPPTLIREALAVTGGASAEQTPAGGLLDAAGEPVGGVANGVDLMAVFAASGVVTSGWVWEHGNPARPFEPHEALDGVEFDTWQDEVLAPPGDAAWLESDRLRPGDHAGCFPAGVIVEGPAASAATLRWYEGTMVELTLAGEQHLTATPNHPVLTARGWVPAEFLREGDNLVRCTDPEAATRLVPGEYQVPTPIEEVVAALGITPGVVARAVPVAAEHFHGDGVGSEVAVVWTDGDLKVHTETPDSEPPLQGTLVRPDAALTPLPRGGGPREHDGRVRDAALGSVGAGGAGTTLLRREGRLVNQALRGHAAGTQADQGHLRRDGLPAGAEALGQSLDGLTGLVEFPQVVRVDVHPFSGHVYNLSTAPGWYLANGFVVHNCTCSFARVLAYADDAEDGE